MLPANSYPFFKKYSHFVGNYGSSWWHQVEDFENFNGVVLFTTNCIVPPRRNATYTDRVYTTGSTGFDGFSTALFDALSELMAKRSFDKITLSDVAAHAGVGRTAVYNHFANKEDLLLAFMEHETARYAEQLSRALTGVEDPIDRLRVYVRQQALVKRSYHFPTTGPLSSSVSRGTAGRLRAHAGLMAQMLAQILSDAMDTGIIPRQDLQSLATYSEPLYS